ncbi:ribosome maturation factor RimM [Sphingomonas sp.]|uniref:ribosome maturation factor RimM n=1 Tax=Sphingomonas sp. TaxID=28214 RepID=UPI00286AA58A|nr:ribosome maturation factor RimM [Sphingomonas sp.]
MTSPATGERRVALAAVAGAHGINGEVRLKLFADSLANLTKGARLFVGGEQRTLVAIKPADKSPIARFEGVADRSAAEALRGSLVEIDRDVLPPLEDGEYYHADLIGMACFDETGAAHGRVVGVENFGAGDLLEIERDDGKRALIPFRDPIATMDDGRILLDPDFLA